MRRVVIAGMIGNGLEWYDFALYGYFAPLLGQLFFPSRNPELQTLAAYGVFAMGFIARPIGAVVFGYLGDKFGRKFALTLSIMLMAVPTACIGLLPTYAQIGMAAPILLIIIRILQGAALAGQFSGSIAFIVEHAPKGRRGVAGSMTVLSLCMGMLLGSLMATMAAELLTREQYESWGWRIPFLLGIVIAYVGHYIRHNTEESPAYEKARDEGALSETPVMELCRHHSLLLLRGIGIYLSVTVPFYTLTVFLPGFLHKFMGQPEGDALLMGTAAMIVMMCLVPLTGWLSDRVGHKRLLMAVSVVYFFASYPIFVMLTRPGFWEPFTAELLFSFMISSYIGAAPAVFVELFPTSVRYTGMALSYNICAAVFGGTTPIIGTWLVMQSRKPPLSDSLLIQAMEPNTIVAFYLMLCAVLSFVSFIGYRDRYRDDLE